MGKRPTFRTAEASESLLSLKSQPGRESAVPNSQERARNRLLNSSPWSSGSGGSPDHCGEHLRRLGPLGAAPARPALPPGLPVGAPFRLGAGSRSRHKTSGLPRGDQQRLPQPHLATNSEAIPNGRTRRPRNWSSNRPIASIATDGSLLSRSRGPADRPAFLAPTAVLGHRRTLYRYVGHDEAVQVQGEPRSVAVHAALGCLGSASNPNSVE